MTNTSGFIPLHKGSDENVHGDFVEYDGARYRRLTDITTGGTAICSVLTKCSGPITSPQRIVLKKLRHPASRRQSIIAHEYEVGHLLHSEYIARYLSYSEEDNSLYIEYVDGLTLDNFIQTPEGQEYFTGADAYHHIHDFCIQVLSGMQQIHANRLCHCDLKPSNIMIRSGADHRAVIIDLGMAITQGVSMIIGTTESQKAPEMKLGETCEISILCDIYMFGLVMRQVAASCPVYEPICRLCTQEIPADRYQSVLQVINAIEEVYSKKVNDEFNRIISLNDGTRQLKVENSKIFDGDKFIGNIKDLPFAHNSQTYLQLLIKRQQLQIRTEELKKLGDDDRDYLLSLHQLSSIKTQIDDYEQNLLDLAKIIHGIHNDINDHLYDEIHTLFEAGDIKRAKSLINERELKSSQKSAHARLVEAWKENERIMRIYHLRAKLTELDDNDDKRYNHADSDYKETISIAHDINYDREETAEMLFDHAMLQLHYDHSRRGIDIFRQSLNLCKTLPKSEGIRDNISNIKNNIALLDMQLGNYARAEKTLQQALCIDRILSKTDDDYLINVASTLDNLIQLHCILNKFGLAEKEVREAVKIKKHLVELDFTRYAEEYVITLTNASAYHYSNSQYGKSVKESNEVLRICKKVKVSDKSRFISYQAMAHTNLGVANSDTGHPVKAKQELKSAIAIYRELAVAHPDMYLPEAATALNNISCLYLDIHQYNDALTASQEALHIYTDLSEKEPQEYKPHIAWTYHNIASIYYTMNNFEEAEKQYSLALKLYKLLLKKNPEAYKPDAILTITNLLQLYKDTHQNSKYHKLDAIFRTVKSK